MTADPKDAEIARLTAALAESEAATEGALMVLVQAQAERDAKSKWLGELLAVIHRDGGHYQEEHGDEKAVRDAHLIVAYLLAGRDTALAQEQSAHSRAIYDAEKAEAERDAALAQVAMTVFCTDCENTTTRTDDDRCGACGSGRIMAGKAPSEALSRRDTQMRAEGYRIAAEEARKLGAHIVAPEHCPALATAEVGNG